MEGFANAVKRGLWEKWKHIHEQVTDLRAAGGTIENIPGICCKQEKGVIWRMVAPAEEAVSNGFESRLQRSALGCSGCIPAVYVVSESGRGSFEKCSAAL